MPETITLGLPEFTRALRVFATRAALGTMEQRVLFAPLLAARVSASRVSGAEGRIAAFDATRLRTALNGALTELALAREPKSEPDRRAALARLHDAAAPTFAALEQLRAAAAEVRAASSEAGRASCWPQWTAAVQTLFTATDGMLAEVLEGRESAARSGAASRAIGVALFAVGACSSLLAAPLSAQHVTLRVPSVRAESLQARGFDVVGVDRGDALVVVDARERARLAGLGWQGAEVRSLNALAPSAVSAAPFRDYDDASRGVRAFIDSLARVNSRVSVDTLGLSYEKRPMLAVKIGPKGDSPSRPNVIFVATYHAREWGATETALRLITYLATASNARVDSLLQTRDIWIIPVANPDGYQYTFTADRLWRKTRSPQAGGAVGVDMNRNHRASWGLDNVGSSNDPGSEIFRGPSPASEIETRNIEAFHTAHPPVVSMSYHTYAGLLMFPPGAVYGEVPADLPAYQTLAGTNAHPAVKDRLQGSMRTFYSPSEAWTLYTTNGEYNDWASATFGALSFTTELSSGYNVAGYYGFEFPADTTQLRTLFDDNLPFALDLIESAGDPSVYASPSTAQRPRALRLESLSPDIRVTVPKAAVANVTLSAPTPLAFRVDSTSGARYFRRLIAGSSARPAHVTVSASGQSAAFTALGYGGAEVSDTGWTATSFVRDSTFTMAGKYSWRTPGRGELKSPVYTVPATVDTVSLIFWTRYNGSGFDEAPAGLVEMSTDGGTTFSLVARMQGFGPLYYPEQVTVGGVKGRKIQWRFTPIALQWWLDEITTVAHGAVQLAPAATSLPFLPSENPVKRSAVYFQWPFPGATGDLHAYDITGRLVWRSQVTQDGNVKWDLAASSLPNGVYLVVARSAGKVQRLKLFVTRDGR